MGRWPTEPAVAWRLTPCAVTKRSDPSTLLARLMSVSCHSHSSGKRGCFYTPQSCEGSLDSQPMWLTLAQRKTGPSLCLRSPLTGVCHWQVLSWCLLTAAILVTWARFQPLFADVGSYKHPSFMKTPSEEIWHLQSLLSGDKIWPCRVEWLVDWITLHSLNDLSKI